MDDTMNELQQTDRWVFGRVMCCHRTRWNVLAEGRQLELMQSTDDGGVCRTLTASVRRRSTQRRVATSTNCQLWLYTHINTRSSVTGNFI